MLKCAWGCAAVTAPSKDLPLLHAWAEDAVAVSDADELPPVPGSSTDRTGRVRLDMGDLSRCRNGSARRDAKSRLRLHSNFDLACASLYLAALLSAQNRPEAGDFWRKRAVNPGKWLRFSVEQERPLI